MPKVRNEGENFGRDLVDWRDPVPPGPNQLVDLENVSLEDIELKCDTRKSQYKCMLLIVCLTSAGSGATVVLQIRISAHRRD